MKKPFTLKYLELDDRKLSEQWLFKLSILIPLLISILLSIPLWLKTQWDFSAKGYDVFLNLYKLPIGILSLSIPFVAIVAHIHRTIQTSEQINTTRRKNAADSFFAHHKFMIESINKISDKEMIILNGYTYKISDPYHLYDNFFKNSSYENGINTSNISFLTKEIENSINNIKKSIVDARELIGNKNLKIVLLSQLISSMEEIERILTIQFKRSKQNFVVMDKNSENTVMLAMASRSEIDIKERLSNLIYCIKKVYQLINIKFEDGDDDDLYFYAELTTPNYCFYDDVFMDIIPARINERFSISLPQSDMLEGYYTNYIEQLQKQKNANDSARQKNIV